VVANKQLYAGSGLQFDESAGNKKELNLRLACGKKNAIAVTNQSSKVTQFRCLVNVGVYALKAPEKGANFEILLHNLNKHVLVKSNVWGFYRLVEKQTVLLHFNFQRRQFETYRDISFKVDLKYGDAEVFISKKNQVPCNDQSVELYSNSLQKYTVNDLLFFRHRSEEQKLQGTYYICIVAKSLTSIGLYIQPEAARNPEKGN
jgi:hypothetical protein